MNVQFCTFAWAKQTKFNFKVNFWLSLHFVSPNRKSIKKFYRLTLREFFQRLLNKKPAIDLNPILKYPFDLKS